MNLKNRANLVTVILCFSIFATALPLVSRATDKADSIRGYQQSLIKNEITGSNVVMIYRDGKRAYFQAVQSGKTGDRDINASTLFPIWSMTKPITIA